MNEFSHEVEAALRHREAHDCALIELPGMSWWNQKSKTEQQKLHIKDRGQTLAAGLRLSYEQKKKHAIKVIERSLSKPVEWAVSYSGGRDSTLLSHLMVFGMGITHVPHVMSNTRMEYPESVKMVNLWYARLRELGVRCEVVFPEKRPNVLWKEIGVPVWSKEIAYKYRKFAKSKSDRISPHVPANLHEQFRKAKAAGLKITDQCCEALKKKPMRGWDLKNGINGHFTGVRCAESRSRRLAWIMKGALYQAVTHHDMWISNPLAFWTDADVASYMAEHDIKVLKPDTACSGSGCVTCMFGCHMRKQEGTMNSMQDLETRNPRMWRTALDDWGYRQVLDTLGIDYGTNNNKTSHEHSEGMEKS